MSCHLLTGRADRDRTGALYQLLFRALEEKQRRVYLILPEQATFRHELEIEELRGERSLWNLEITSLARLGDCYVKKNVMDSLGRNFLVYGILAEKKDEFSAFQAKDISGGFVQDIASVIKEVFMNGLSPDFLRESAEEMETRDNAGDLPDKLRDLAVIKEAMEDSGYCDESGVLYAFAEVIAKERLFADDVFCFDEFFDFTSAEYAVLAAMAKNGCRMIFSFLYDKQSEVFAKTAKAINQLMSFTYHGEEPLEITALHSEKGDSALDFLEQHFFCQDGALWNRDVSGIEIVAAEDKREEIRHMAQQICALTDSGYDRSDIGICFRNMEGYEKYIEEIFASYGIPCFVDTEVSLLNHPVFRFGAGLFRVAAEKWSFASVFALLKSGLFPISDHDCDLLENYCLAHNLKGRRFYQEEPWTYRNEREREDPEAVDQIRREMLNTLLPVITLIKNQDTAKNYAKILWQFLDICRCDLTINAWCEEGMARGEIEKNAELAVGLSSLGEMLDQLVAAFPDHLFTKTEFMELLKIGAASVSVKTIPSQLDTVEIDILGISRPGRKKVVFLGGCNEGIFPAAESDGGFLNSTDRGLLKDATEQWIQDKTFFYEGENILVYQGLTLAKENLILSYARHDEGKAAFPSPLLRRIRKMFPKIQETIVSDGAFDDAIFYSLDEVLSALPRALRQGNDRDWEKVKEELFAAAETAPRTEKLLTSLSYTGQSKTLSPRILSAYPGEELSLSVSAIEQYRRCPFAYFSRYGLKLKERKILEFAAPDLGNIFHETLCELTERMSAAEIPWSALDTEGKKLVEEMVGEKLRFFSEENLFPREQLAYIGFLLTENLSFVLEMMALQIKKGDRFRPLHWEVPFGKGKTLPSYDIAVDDSGHCIHLRGIIDRVDIAEKGGREYFRIVDYKSFGKDLALDEIYYGLKLQLPVYMMVMEQSAEELKPAGIFYQTLKDAAIKEDKSLSDEEIREKLNEEMELKGYIISDGASEECFALKKGRMLTVSEHDHVVDHTRQKIKEIGGEIFTGRTAIRPFVRKNESSCKYCPYDAVCGYESDLIGKEEQLPALTEAAVKVLLGEEES